MKEKTKNTSTRKKLVPAVSMLTVSAIMLSSATYAWFTMNKEVEVTGLQMEAVAGDALEISLGAYADSITSITAPSDKNDASWKRSIAFSEYYQGFSALKPASSDTGLKIVAIDETKVSGGGATVDSSAALYTVGAQTEGSAYNKTAEINYAGNQSPTTFDENNAGYYLDIPMWIRTNKTVEGEGATVDVDCTVSITDTSNTAKNGDLKNAVRVAIIPVKTGATQAGFIASGADIPTATNGALTAAQTQTVFGLTSGTLTTAGVLSANATGTYGAATKTASPSIIQAASTLRSANLDNDPDDSDDANDTPETVTFKLPSASQDDYSGCAFIVRVWLEGESKYCLDATANQDWRLDFHFELCDHTDGTGHASAASADKASDTTQTT